MRASIRWALPQVAWVVAWVVALVVALVVATGVMIPLEVYEMIHQASWLKAIVLAANAAVIWYLAVNLRRTRSRAS